jgi:hypothetical protein
MKPRIFRPVKSIGRAVWSRERFVLAVGIEPDDQLVTVDAAAHVALDHERQPAEHLAFADLDAPGKEGAHARSKVFVVGHPCLLGEGSWEAEGAENAGVSKAGDCGDAVAAQGEDHQAVCAGDRAWASRR